MRWLLGWDIFHPEFDSKSQVDLYCEMLVSARHLTAYLAAPIDNYHERSLHLLTQDLQTFSLKGRKNLFH